MDFLIALKMKRAEATKKQQTRQMNMQKVDKIQASVH